MSCLIFDCGSSTQQQIIERLLPDEKIDFSGKVPVWNISNKYYKAKVHLKVFKNSSENSTFVAMSSESKSFAIGGSVFFAETFETESQILLESWRNFVSQKLKNSDDEGEGPEIKLLVVGQFKSEDVKCVALQWAMKNGFEIVDFSDEDEDDDTEGLTCSSNFGPKRVVEALQTCLWNSLEDDEKEAGAAATHSSKDECDDDVTAAEMDDFETLFAQFASFKSTSENLSDEDRKALAEKVALSFYKSLGGESEDGSESSIEN